MHDAHCATDLGRMDYDRWNAPHSMRSISWPNLRRLGVPLRVAICATLLPLGAWGAPRETATIIVKMRSGLTADQEAAVVARGGGTKKKGIPQLRLHVITVPQAAADAIRSRY